jgi:protein SCO1/2
MTKKRLAKQWKNCANTLMHLCGFFPTLLRRPLLALPLGVIMVDLRAAPESEPVSSPAIVVPVSADDESTQGTAAQRYFTDVELTNQDGKTLRLYSDLLRGKVVVIASFFSSCTGVCKVTMPMLHHLQERFAERPGAKVYLISISVDPETDTPAVLRKYASGLGAREGWDFLTGDKQSVDVALQKLGFATEMREGHSNVFIVGNESTGLWKKVFGIGSPDEIASAVESVLADGP